MSNIPVPTPPSAPTPPAPTDPNRIFIAVENLTLQFLLYRNKGMQLKEFLIDLVLGGLRRLTQRERPEFANKHRFDVIKNVSLQIEAGTRLGIIGRNGAGKTTLLRCLARIYQPTAGRIVVNGRVAALLEIGSGFDPELTAYENILLGGSLFGRSVKHMRERADAIIEFAGIRDFADVPIKYYSTGMNLRLAFALATDVEPDILLLDELFAGGDLDFTKRAQARMTSLIARTQIMVLVSHQNELIRQFCTEVLWIEQGEIRMRGPAAEVLAAYGAAASQPAPPRAADPAGT